MLYLRVPCQDICSLCSAFECCQNRSNHTVEISSYLKSVCVGTRVVSDVCSVPDEHLYSTSHSIEPYRSLFWCNLLQENIQVLRWDNDVERLEGRKVAQVDGKEFRRTIPKRVDDSKRSRLSHSVLAVYPRSEADERMLGEWGGSNAVMKVSVYLCMWCKRPLLS